MLLIRPESPRDAAAIDAVNLLAFGQDAEGRLVHAVRASRGFIPELSLVAFDGEGIIGHILFSPVVIEGPAGITPALALAPMAVTPTRQRSGVGSTLVRYGLERACALGHRIVVVVGHPAYYPRFGFTPARARGLEAPFPVPDEAFMVLELASNALAGISGTVKYPPPFDAAA
jgi:putative acetyltransferase